jgi:hypothetical protein
MPSKEEAALLIGGLFLSDAVCWHLAKGADMDQTFLLPFCFCVGFISGYGVRAVISQYRRRKEGKAREERKAARKAREARLQQSLDRPNRGKRNADANAY